jgi:hypothetical protein
MRHGQRLVSTSGRSRACVRRSASRGCSATASARMRGAASSPPCGRPCASASRPRPRAMAARSRRRSTAAAGSTGATSGRPGRSRCWTRCRRSSRARSRAPAVAFARASRPTACFTISIISSASASSRPSCCVTSRRASCRTSTTRSRTRRTPTAASRPACGRTVDDNLAPHGWFAAELVALIRTMLVRERRRARAAVGGPGALARAGARDGRARRVDEARRGRRVAAPGPRRAG